MTAQQKAKELVAQMWVNPVMHFNNCKQCALITVEEIQKIIQLSKHIKFWNNVKAEVEKL